MSKIPRTKALAPEASNSSVTNEESKDAITSTPKLQKQKTIGGARPVTARTATKSDVKTDDDAPNDDPIGIAMQARLKFGKT